MLYCILLISISNWFREISVGNIDIKLLSLLVFSCFVYQNFMLTYFGTFVENLHYKYEVWLKSNENIEIALLLSVLWSWSFYFRRQVKIFRRRCEPHISQYVGFLPPKTTSRYIRQPAEPPSSINYFATQCTPAKHPGWSGSLCLCKIILSSLIFILLRASWCALSKFIRKSFSRRLLLLG